MGSAASKVLAPNAGESTQDVPAFKIVLVGESQVGKTSIFLRFTREQFDYSYQPTMQVNIGIITKKVNIPYETVVSVTVWDVPGREEIDLRRSYYRDIDAAIVVVDLSDEDSIELAGMWKQDLVNNVLYTENDGEKKRERKKSLRSQLQIPILLVGNKLDKVAAANDDEEVPKPVECLEDIAKQHGFVGCVSVSAKEGDGGVHAAMTQLVRFLLEKKHPDKVTKKKREGPNLRDIFDPAHQGKYSQMLGSIDEHDFPSLEHSKIPEFDQLFDLCEKHVKVIEKMSVSLLLSVKNFKRACCIAGITDSYKASLEECITSLKDALRDDREDDILLAREEAGYISLFIEEKHTVQGSMQRVLDVYTNEVCKVTRRVLAQCPIAKVKLMEQLNELEKIKGVAMEKAVEMNLNKKQAKLSVSIIEENMTRIRDASFLADESMKVTDDQFKKIKNAIMW